MLWEDRVVTISRVNGTLAFSANFMLIGAMNCSPAAMRLSDPWGVAGADICYRREGTTPWSTKAMATKGASVYTTHIDCSDIASFMSSALEFYVRARPARGNLTSSGTKTVSENRCVL